MEQIEHKMVSANGLEMHIAELGKGPLVLLLHGFPELWYSWRHQILFLAAHGYRVVAPDLRGYGDTTGVPVDDSSKFTVLHIVCDLIGLLDSIAPNKEDRVFVVGHDWGAYMAWYMGLFRPDRVNGLVNLSVPFFRRDPAMTLLDVFKSECGDDFYFCRFQEPGEIEAELSEIDTKTVVTEFLSTFTKGTLYLPKGKGFGDRPETPTDRPPWLSDADVEYYASKFSKTGFTGGINYYRAIERNWELTAPWTGAKMKVPAKFVVGELDLTYHMPGFKDYIHNGGFKDDVPLLDEVEVIHGASHFIQQERPDEINKIIYAFLQKLGN